VTENTIQVHTYLSTTPAVVQTTEGVTECFKYLDKFNLTKAEKLQVVNLAPNTDVDVHAVCMRLWIGKGGEGGTKSFKYQDKLNLTKAEKLQSMWTFARYVGRDTKGRRRRAWEGDSRRDERSPSLTDSTIFLNYYYLDTTYPTISLL
jgi:hypothetical protein